MHYSSNVTADLDNNCHRSVVAVRRYQIERGVARAEIPEAIGGCEPMQAGTRQRLTFDLCC